MLTCFTDAAMLQQRASRAADFVWPQSIRTAIVFWGLTSLHGFYDKASHRVFLVFFSALLCLRVLRIFHANPLTEYEGNNLAAYPLLLLGQRSPQARSLTARLGVHTFSEATASYPLSHNVASAHSTQSVQRVAGRPAARQLGRRQHATCYRPLRRGSRYTQPLTAALHNLSLSGLFSSFKQLLELR